MSCATPDCHSGYTLVWLADVLRAAGLNVIEQPAWQTRGHGDVGQILGVLCHDTVSPPGSNAPDLGIVTHGRSDLAGPLSQLLLARDGTYYVIAAGKCWHAGAGLWHGVSDGNAHFIGIEAENNGVDEPWSEKQLDAYARGCAAILNHVKAPVWMCAGHKEYCIPHGRKIDPDLDMAAFRLRVAGHMGLSKVGKMPLAPPRAIPATKAAPQIVLASVLPQISKASVIASKPSFSLGGWLASLFKPKTQGYTTMVTGSKTYMGVASLLTWIVGMVTNGQLPIMPAIGAGLAALTLAALRHGLSTGIVTIIDNIAAAFENSNDKVIATVADTVDAAVKQALADYLAGQTPVVAKAA